MEILESFLVNELYDVAKQLGVPCKKGLKKGELRVLLEKYFDENPNHTMASGYLEVLSDGYGFLRNTSVEKDIYISASQIRKFKLRTGDVVMGEVRRPTGEEKNFRSEEHTSELKSRQYLVCRLLLEKKYLSPSSPPFLISSP